MTSDVELNEKSICRHVRTNRSITGILLRYIFILNENNQIWDDKTLEAINYFQGSITNQHKINEKQRSSLFPEVIRVMNNKPPHLLKWRSFIFPHIPHSQCVKSERSCHKCISKSFHFLFGVSRMCVMSPAMSSFLDTAAFEY